MGIANKDTGTASSTDLKARRSKDLAGQGGVDQRGHTQGPTWRERMAELDISTEEASDKPRAYSYLRFSTPEQMQGDSFRRQSTLASAFADKHGLELDAELTFEDLGVSAYRGANFRGGALGLFLEAVDSGEVPQGSYLLIESLDRMSRMDPWDALPVFQQLINTGVNVVTLIDERVYSREEMRAQPMRIMESLFVMIRANEESATKSRRLKAAWEGKRAKLASEGKPLTSKCPAWLRLNKETEAYEVIPERAEIVREIYERAAKGEGQNAIAQSLNARGEPVWGPGKQWHVSYIAKILENRAVIGELQPHRMDYSDGERRRIALEPIADVYPPVVERETYARVRDIRSAPSAHRGPSSKRIQNILAGLAKCPKCGGTMTRISKGSRAKAGPPYLVCVAAKTGAGCSYKTVKYESIENAIIRNASAIYEYSPIGDKGGDLDDEIENAEIAIDVKEDAIRHILDFIETGGTVSRATRQELAELEAEHAVLEQRYSALMDQLDLINTNTVDARLEELEGALTETPTNRERINAAMRTLVDHVVVEYGGGELIFNWRHGGETRIGFAWPNGEGA